MSALWDWLGRMKQTLVSWVGEFVSSLRTNAIFRMRTLAVLAAVCVVGYVLGVLSYVLLTPEIGIRCAFSHEVHRFYPAYLDPPGQEPLRPGDEILQIGNTKIDSWPRLLRQLAAIDDHPTEAGTPELLKTPPSKSAPNALVLEGRKLIRVQYRRGDSNAIQWVWCRVSRPAWETLAPTLLWLVLKLGLFAVGAFVFWKRSDDRAARIFFLYCVISAGAFIGGNHWHRIAPQPPLLIVFMFCSILLPSIGLHFYLVFPEPKKFLDAKPLPVMACIYGPAALLFAWLSTDYIRVRWLLDHQHAPMTLVEPLLDEMVYAIYIAFGLAAFAFVSSIAALFHSFRSADSPTHRNQVKWILFGNLAALVPIGYSLYLAFVQQERFGGGGATWPMFVASFLLTVAFTVSITRYRLMELDQLISSGAMYFLLSSLAGVLYYVFVVAGLLIVGSQVTDGPTLGQVLAVSSSALLLLIALDLARGRLRSVLDGRFRKEKHNLDRTLQQMRQTIDRLVDPPTLARRLLQTATGLFSVQRGSIYLRQGSPPLYTLSDSLGETPPLTELSSGCPLVSVLERRGSLRSKDGTTPEQRQLAHLGGQLAIALRHEGSLLGFFVLGPKAAGHYSSDDVALLSACAQLASLALVSAEGHRTIESLNGELQEKVEKIAEQQQRILHLQSQLSHLRKSAPRTTAAAESSKAPTEPEESDEQMVGSSPQARSLLTLVHKVAPSSSAVLLRGESGTGKGVLARLIHEHSNRADRPFLEVHCAALTPSLLESELFGHVKGAFTGAINNKTGRFEAAHRGTLFLDEIGDISLEVQTKLLRVIQEKTFERVGSIDPIEVDVRILAATHQNLEDLIAQGRFREDLFYRLNVFPIHVLPLRERIEDIPELTGHFLKLYSRKAGKELDGIDDDTLAVLKGYSWPGNIRQLENVIERAVVIADGTTIQVEELPQELLDSRRVSRAPAPPMPSVESSNEFGSNQIEDKRQERIQRERESLVRALAASGGNKAEAARNLGVARSTLVSRLKKHGLG